MTEQDARQQYWDNYINYWLERVADSNNERKNTDKMADDSVMQSYIELLADSIKAQKSTQGGGQNLNSCKILDYGCGFGRAYPYFERLDCTYFGCDIAKSCIDHTLQAYPKATAKKLLDNDIIPFESNAFDGVFCYGVFDACFQHITLGEILRVLKTGGIALITGKNDNYLESDEAALVAEVAARKNQHPNFFTNTKAMIDQLKARGFKILQSRFFLERKDNATDTFITQMPEQFYTYALLIQKCQDSVLEAFEPLSSTHSKTFHKKNSSL